MLSNLNNEITKPGKRKQAARRGTDLPLCRAVYQPQEPVPVEIRQPNPSPFLLILGGRRAPASTSGDGRHRLVFVIFFLLQREDLRDRFIRLAGAGDLRRTTVAWMTPPAASAAIS